MHRLLQEMLSMGPVVSDGAWGTQLQARGLAPGAPPDEWNLSHPDRVFEVGKAYVAAGSRVILTNSFGANRIALRRHGLEGKAVEINRAAAGLSRDAADGKAKVFGSMGPCGKLTMTGEVDEDGLRTSFREQAEALAEAGVDGLVVETMTALDEARVAVAAARATGLPVVASLVFDSGRDRDRTMMGVTPEQAAALLEEGADLLGANCGQGIGGFGLVCKRLHAAGGGRPVWIKANAGLRGEEGAEEFARHAPLLRDAGAGVLGGCCGTGPGHVRALQTALSP